MTAPHTGGFKNATEKEMAALAKTGEVTVEALERLREERRKRNRERRQSRKANKEK